MVNPLAESVDLMEDLVMEYVTETVISRTLYQCLVHFAGVSSPTGAHGNIAMIVVCLYFSISRRW